MNSNIDLLIIFPCSENSISSIENVCDYASMQAFFISKHLENNPKIKTVCIDNIWKKKYTKQRVSFSELNQSLINQNIDISKCNNILFTKLGVSKQLGSKSIRELKNNTSAKLFKLEDTNIRLVNNFTTIGHFVQTDNNKNFINAGLSVCTETFLPQQPYDTVFRVHVDHNYKGVDNYFSLIKDILLQLESKIKNHQYWSELEIIYHTEKSNINNLGHYDFNNVKITELASIYGRTNLAFLSHRESMGQYQLEMLSCGANVILPNKFALPENVRKQLPLTYYKDLNYDQILDVNYLKQTQIKNRSLVQEFDYKEYVNKIIQCVFDNC